MNTLDESLIAIFWIVASLALIVACMVADGPDGPGTL
jgi:hypothetical protein